MRSRSGSVLVVVSGVVALLAALALAFLTRVREDAEETDALVGETQARIMLLAACDYVLESGRLGWDARPTATPRANPPMPTHVEAYGWIDVRDTAIGPCGDGPSGARPPLYNDAIVEDSDGDHVPDRPRWPAIHSVARCPMHVLARPPFAERLDAVYNPIQVDDPAAADYGLPYLRNPDPQPAVDNGWPTAVSDATPQPDGRTAWQAWVAGDARPRPDSTGRSWFRVYRDGPGTFVLTCGGGATLGFRDWGEVVAAGETDAFAGDQALFAALVAREIRLWYRVQWSPATMALDYDLLCGDLQPKDHEHFMIYPPNASETWLIGRRTQLWNKDLVGTIQWVQRLVAPPSRW